jgi:hypothetical protein
MRKMTESREVMAVRGLSARSGPHRLDRDVAWTTWRGSTRASWLRPARARTGHGRRAETVTRGTALGCWLSHLVQVMDQWVHHPDQPIGHLSSHGARPTDPRARPRGTEPRAPALTPRPWSKPRPD